MPSPLVRHAAGALVAGAVALLVAAAGMAIAADSPDATISVSPRIFVSSPGPSPVDFPGVPSASRGAPLPARHVAVAREVRITRGGESAYAAMRMRCPQGTAWRSGASSGEIGASVLDRTATGRRSVLVMATPAPGRAVGETVRGTIHALCG